jgi:thiol-disulfide isomerase/thioredoxin
MMQPAWRMVDIVSRLLEPDERDAVCGDLAESGASGRAALAGVLGLVVRRQGALWTHGAPWLALVGVVLPCGVLLSHASRWWADGWAIDGFMYLHRWTWSLLQENSGFRDAFLTTGARDLARAAALVGLSWASGVWLASLSRRTLWVTGTLFALTVMGATLGTTTTARVSPYNAEVFMVPFYGMLLPGLSRILFVLLPALRGMRRRTRPSGPRWRGWVAIVLTIEALTMTTGRGLQAAMSFGRVTTAPEPRRPAPDFELRDATGTPVKLSAYQGKVVLLDFWATWCAGCKQEIPWYIEFETKYRPQGLVSIGVAMDDEGWTTVKPYLADHPINYHIVVADPEIAKSYHITSLPVTLLIDRQGRIVDNHLGVVDKDAWEQKIQALLHER